MIALLAAAAHAFEPGDPNHELSFGLAVAVGLDRSEQQDLPGPHPGRGSRVGIELNARWRWALADHCSRNERDGCHEGAWPLAGPAASLGWAGGRDVTAALGADLGAATVDMHQFGYLPLWEFDAFVGVAGAGETGFGLGLGATLGRSLGWLGHPAPNTSTLHGPLPLAATVGARGTWRGELRRSEVLVGAELSPFAGDPF